MRIRIHVHVHENVHVHVHRHIDMHMHTLLHTVTHKHIHIHIHIHMRRRRNTRPHIHICLHLHLHVATCMYICIGRKERDMRVCVYIHIFTHMYENLNWKHSRTTPRRENRVATLRKTLSTWHFSRSTKSCGSIRLEETGWLEGWRAQGLESSLRLRHQR